MKTELNSFRVEFPDFSCSLLKKLNQQRQRGQLCDLVVSVGGHQFRAHRAVLAASSPYFCDQVLLKNSARVVLPDVMHPCVFEQLLLSCYTGALSVPSGEVVAFLTAASFLQMWHVVDKCTDLLERGHKKSSCGGRFKQESLPQWDCYSADNEETAGCEDTGWTGGRAQVQKVEEQGDERIPALGPGTLQRAGYTSPEEPSSENGESDGGENQCCRPAYMTPITIESRRKVHVKEERSSQAACGAIFSSDPVTGDPDQSCHAPHMVEDCFDEKLVSHLEECLDRDCSYEEPLDLYGTSLGGFSQAGDDISHPVSNDKLQLDVADDAKDEEVSARRDGGLGEQISHSGPASGVHKLFPCQCGRTFTHKSQRDRHMSMHLGLRPFGCTLCGKNFKMKHHLVNHMNVHMGSKPYECSLCSKRFTWRDSFNRHTSCCKRANRT